MVTLNVFVKDTAGKAVAGARVVIITRNAAIQPSTRITSGDGGCNLYLNGPTFEPPLTVDIFVDAAGFAPYCTAEGPVQFGTKSIDFQVVLQPFSSASGPASTVPGAPLPSTRGHDFVDGNGKRVVLNGTDQFTAFRLFRDRNMGQLDALVRESHDIGFNMWRVFLTGSVAQNSILQLSPDEPGYYDDLRPFAQFLNSARIALLATANVDAQDIMPSVTRRQQNWLRVVDALRGTDVLLSKGNEFSKNGFRPDELANPTGIEWSQGSDLQDNAPFKPHGPFAEFHPVRGVDRAYMDAVASAVNIYTVEQLAGRLIIDEPLGFADTDQPGRRSNSPVVAGNLGRLYSTLCAAAVFHNDNGMRGQVMSPQVRACAESWSNGMRL